MQPPDALQCLPTDLLHQIFEHLDAKDLVALRGMNRAWRATIDEPAVWNRRLQSLQRTASYRPFQGWTHRRLVKDINHAGIGILCPALMGIGLSMSLLQFRCGVDRGGVLCNDASRELTMAGAAAAVCGALIGHWKLKRGTRFASDRSTQRHQKFNMSLVATLGEDVCTLGCRVPEEVRHAAVFLERIGVEEPTS